MTYDPLEGTRPPNMGDRAPNVVVGARPSASPRLALIMAAIGMAVAVIVGAAVFLGSRPQVAVQPAATPTVSTATPGPASPPASAPVTGSRLMPLAPQATPAAATIPPPPPTTPAATPEPKSSSLHPDD